MVRVEPDFKCAAFIFTPEWSLAETFTFDKLRDAFGDLPAVEWSPKEIRVPFDTDLIGKAIAVMKNHGYEPEGTPEAREVFKFLLERDNAVQGRDVLDLPDELYMHQKLSVEFAASRPYAGLFLEMGLGKTLCALLTARVWDEGRHGTALVVCPKSVIGSWEIEVAKWTPDIQITTLVGTSKQKLRSLKRYLLETEDRRAAGKMGLLVTNFDALLAITVNGELARIRPHTMIVDESIAIKNYGAKRTRAAWQLGTICEHRMILTGEPITQGPEDLFGQLGFLDPSILGGRMKAFKEEYCVMRPLRIGGGRVIQKISGYQNLDKLSAKVYEWCFQVHKHQALDLPPKVYTQRIVPMTPKQATEYKRMADEMVSVVDGEVIYANGVLPQIGKLTQLTAGFMYTEDGDAVRFSPSPKIEVAVEICKDETPRRKVVLWCRHREEINWLYDRLTEEKIGTRVIHGGVHADDRTKSIKLFQEDPEVRVIIGQIQAMGMGVTLTAADLAIYVTNTYSLSDRKQSEDRIHRIGQKRTCEYIDLVCPNTIDKTITKALLSKAGLSKQVTRKEWARMVNGVTDE